LQLSALIAALIISISSEATADEADELDRATGIGYCTMWASGTADIDSQAGSLNQEGQEQITAFL
jgi:hypothetical protein